MNNAPVILLLSCSRLTILTWKASQKNSRQSHGEGHCHCCNQWWPQIVLMQVVEHTDCCYDSWHCCHDCGTSTRPFQILHQTDNEEDGSYDYEEAGCHQQSTGCLAHLQLTTGWTQNTLTTEPTWIADRHEVEQGCNEGHEDVSNFAIHECVCVCVSASNHLSTEHVIHHVLPFILNLRHVRIWYWPIHITACQYTYDPHSSQ